jgi:hypothetical protein
LTTCAQRSHLLPQQEGKISMSIETSNEQPYSGPLVTVATFPEPAEANIARSVLEGAGIAVFLRGEMANSLVPVAFESQLQVRPEDESAARSLLKAAEDAPESLEAVTAAEIAGESASNR